MLNPGASSVGLFFVVLVLASCSREARCTEEIYGAAIIGSLAEDSEFARQAAENTVLYSPDCAPEVTQ